MYNAAYVVKMRHKYIYVTCFSQSWQVKRLKETRILVAAKIISIYEFKLYDVLYYVVINEFIES